MDVNKIRLLERLQRADAIYALISGYTRMPYVVCDEETFDDEVMVFFQAEAAKKEAQRLIDSGSPVHLVKIEQHSLLDFYTSLFPMGVNCLRIDKGTEEEVTLQHRELVQRNDVDETASGKVRVENPELQLTALYFLQEFRKTKSSELSEELKALYEELRAHFERGQYIVAAENEKGLTILKQGEGKVFLPVFTDLQEFRKFNREKKFGGAVVKADKLPKLLTKEMAGVVINPSGMNLVFTKQKHTLQ